MAGRTRPRPAAHVAAIAGDHTLDHVLPDLAAADITEVVLVQTSDIDDDTDTMFAEADNHPQIVGVVAWLPLDEGERAAQRHDTLRGRPRFVGVRSLIHDRADADWLLGDAGKDALKGGDGIDIINPGTDKISDKTCVIDSSFAFDFDALLAGLLSA